jgi:hypothetical protein
MVMLNRKKLTVAVAVALGTSAAALSTAQAGQLFFPQSAVSNTVTTIFSIINTLGNSPATTDRLHYRYYYKVKPPATGDAETDEDAWNALYCEETNEYLPTSKFDIQTIDVTGALDSNVLDESGNPTGVLFNDPSFKNSWKQKGANYALARGVDVPHRGYLVVEHPEEQWVPSKYSGLYGEAIVFEFGAGAAWGYQGFNKPGKEGNYCNFSAAASNSPSHVAVFPFEEAEFTTKFMVTPLFNPKGYPDVCPNDSNWNYATIELEASQYYGNNVVMFDRDENPISGATPKEVVCVGAVTAEYLINDGSKGKAPDGGWTGVLNYAEGGGLVCEGDGCPCDTEGTLGCETWSREPAALLFKLEYGLTSAINGAAPGVYNNAIYLHPYLKWGGSLPAYKKDCGKDSCSNDAGVVGTDDSGTSMVDDFAGG